MIHIRDAVVGNIQPTDNELLLISDKNMQRLRHVKQVSFSYLVYTGANHTRFEHSLGTMLITRQLTEQISDEPIEELECVGLLHDIGHAAFSHASDNLLKKHLKTTHEKIGEQIIKKSSIKDKIQDSTLSFDKIIDYFNGKGKGEIVTGSIGSDRLDYLTRDAHYTGVAYGVIDYQNIRDTFTLYKGRPAIFQQGLISAENLLIARYSMFSSVYHHHTSVIAQDMYENAVDAAIDSGKMDAEELKSLNDWEMLTKLLGIKESRELTQRIINRRLFKRAYSDYVERPPKIDDISKAIEKTGIKKGEYTTRYIQIKLNDPHNTNVVSKEAKLLGVLSEISPLVKTLMSTLGNRRRLIVSCDAKNVSKVRTAVERAL